MPLGSWIGSNQGLRTRGALEIIIEQSLVPVVVDAGIGAPSQAAEAMEMGAARGAGQHRHRHGRRPGGHGRRLPPGGRGRPAGLPGRAAGGGPGGRRRPRPSPASCRDRDRGRRSQLESSRPAGVPPGTAAADLLAIDLDGPGGAWRPSATAADVDRALRAGRRRSLADLAVLLSPAAGRPAGGPGRGRGHGPPCSASDGWCACSPRCTCPTSASRRAPTAGSRPATTSPAAR